MIGLIFGILVAGLFSILVFAEENITCSSNSECGEVSTSFPSCKNETHICTITTTPTCNNASTNISSCEDVRVEDCFVCVNGCASGFCLEEELEVCDSDNLNLCLNESDCENVMVGGFWYNEICNYEEEEVEDEVEDEDEDEDEGNESNNGLGQLIRQRVKAGVYTDEQGNQIRVSELARNRIQFKYGEDGEEVETELEIEEETEGNKTKLKVKLNNGRNAEIKIMPEVASETALNRLRLKVCSLDNNCSIELKEVAAKRKTYGNETSLAYEIQAERNARLFWIFKTKMQVGAEVDAETGELIRVKKPWWAFLAYEGEE